MDKEVNDDKEVKLCPSKSPEPHILGEFPMSCYYCHLEADG